MAPRVRSIAHSLTSTALRSPQYTQRGLDRPQLVRKNIATRVAGVCALAGYVLRSACPCLQAVSPSMARRSRATYRQVLCHARLQTIPTVISVFLPDRQPASVANGI